MSEYEGLIVTVQAFPTGGGTAFTIAPKVGDRVVLATSSPIVQGELLRGFMTGAYVKVETEGTTPVIHRVDAFEPGTGNVGLFPFDGQYRLSRLATQRTPSREYVEAFLIMANNQATQFLVFDPTLQAVFFALFERKTPASDIPFHIEYDGNTVTSIRVGTAP